MRTAAFGLIGLALGGAGLACQSYNMEGVDPQTVIAVETSGTFTAGKPPALLIVQDRSGSMEICFGAGGGGGGQRCDSNGDGTVDRDGSSRMHVSQRVMTNVLQSHRDEVLFGLVLYGVDGADPACGDPQTIATPGLEATSDVIAAYQSDPSIVDPNGGTPTTRALLEARDALLDENGKLRMPERDNYVVLVTDGLMNCNLDHPMPCICANDSGCPTTDGGMAQVGDEGSFMDGRFCLDNDASIAVVNELREAGVKTFVIGLGEAFSGGSSLGVESLNALAEAGGVPRTDGGEKFYSAADEQQLQASLDDIIAKIVVPCEYELDGPVCDGRLVHITMEIDGEEVPTSCGEGENTWLFAERPDGTLDEQRIVFSPDLCARFGEAEQVKISIKGIESGCERDEAGALIGPACDLRELSR